MSETTPTLLVLDDDDALRRSMVRSLTKQGFVALPAETSAQARDLLLTARPDCAILDLFLGGRDADGIEVAELASAAPSRPAIIIITAAESTRLGLDLGRIGVDGLLRKPFRPHELLAEVDAALQRRQQGLSPGGGLSDVLAATRQRLVAQAYRATRGNRTAAARLLGISRQHLQLMERRGHVVLEPRSSDEPG